MLLLGRSFKLFELVVHGAAPGKLFHGLIEKDLCALALVSFLNKRDERKRKKGNTKKLFFLPRVPLSMVRLGHFSFWKSFCSLRVRIHFRPTRHFRF
jgi:hypothetical protein